MLRIAFRIVGQTADAEEVRQSVLLRLVQEPKRASGIRDVASWIRRCVVNEAIAHLRKARRRSYTTLDPQLASCPPSSPSDDLTLQIQSALSELEPRQRALLSLRFDEGLTIREIGDALQTPHTTIQSQLQSAISALRSRLNLLSR